MAEPFGLPFLRALLTEAAVEDARSTYDPDRLRLALTVPAGGDDLPGLRARLVGVLKSDRFVLEPLFDTPEPAEPVTYTLAANGLDRTLPEDVLFAIAADLRAELGLIACDPDLGIAAYAEPQKDTQPGTEGVILDATCWVQGTPPEPKT